MKEKDELMNLIFSILEPIDQVFQSGEPTSEEFSQKRDDQPAWDNP